MVFNSDATELSEITVRIRAVSLEPKGEKGQRLTTITKEYPHRLSGGLTRGRSRASAATVIMEGSSACHAGTLVLPRTDKQASLGKKQSFLLRNSETFRAL